MLLEPFSSVSAQTVLETYTYTYGVKGGSERLRNPPPPPPVDPHPHRAVAPPPTQCCPHQPPVHPPPVASYWRSQPLAGRLRAIRPTLVGYVLSFSCIYERFHELLLSYWWILSVALDHGNRFWNFDAWFLKIKFDGYWHVVLWFSYSDATVFHKYFWPNQFLPNFYFCFCFTLSYFDSH